MFRTPTLAMILAGGRVDELGVLTHYRPKSAVPFGGFARVIDFPLSNLMHSGIERIAILSQYRSYSLINHIGTGAAWDMIGRHRGISILPPFKDYESPDWYRGSADAVYQNLDFMQYYDPGNILILSGDHIYRMDYQEMIAYHLGQDADLTAAFIQVPEEQAHRFGVAEIGGDDALGGPLLSYEEKPLSPKSNWASLTILCFRPRILYEMLKRNQQHDSYEFGRDIIPMMMRERCRVFGFKFRGYWGYTKTVDEYWRTSMDLLGGEPRIDPEGWGIRTNLEHRDIRGCQPLLVGAQGTLDNSVAYNGCEIFGRVENSILFPGVKVAPGALVRDSVLFFNNVVAEDATVVRAVSDVNTIFGAGCTVGGESPPGASNSITVIGWNNRVPEGLHIGRGCTIRPRLAPGAWPAEAIQDREVL